LIFYLSHLLFIYYLFFLVLLQLFPFTLLFFSLPARQPQQAVEHPEPQQALVLGVEKAGSTDPAKVRDAIAGLNTDSFFGPIKFDPTGKNSEKPMSAIQIQKGKPITIYPADQAQAKLQWPAGG